MSTTIVKKFVGTPTLTPKKVSIFEDWYHLSLGDADKADGIDESMYYQGMADSLEDVLTVIYNMPARAFVTEAVEEVAKVAKETRSFKNTAIVIGVVGVSVYALWNYEKIKARLIAENNKLRAQAQEDAKIRKIQEDHKDN